MSPIFVRLTYAVAFALASTAFWLASNIQIPAVLLDRVFSLATQVAGLALAVAAIVGALPTRDLDYVLQGRRHRVGQMSAILAIIGVLCATAGILSPICSIMKPMTIALGTATLVVFLALIAGLALTKH